MPIPPTGGPGPCLRRAVPASLAAMFLCWASIAVAQAPDLSPGTLRRLMREAMPAGAECTRADDHYFSDRCAISEPDRSTIAIVAHTGDTSRLIVNVQTAPTSALRQQGLAVARTFMASLGLKEDIVSSCLNSTSGTGATFQQAPLFVRCDATGDYASYSGDDAFKLTVHVGTDDF